MTIRTKQRLFLNVTLMAGLLTATISWAQRVIPDLNVLRVEADRLHAQPRAGLSALSGVGWASEGVQPASFTPNDPLFGNQWHLGPTGTGAPHVNVQGAWDLGYSGAGVVIGIVDDGVEIAHPDLAPALSAGDSWDFVDDDADPSPVLADDSHGTAVAGVAAARGNNGIGVASPAYNAQIAGLRVGYGDQGTTQQFIDATLFHSSSATASQNTIAIKNHSYGIAAPYVDDAGTLATSAALAQSAAAGTIHVIAAGNEGGDANWKRLQSTTDGIIVSALNDSGTFAWYSNLGANVTVTAPSNGGVAGITTTDRTGDEGYNTAATTTDYADTSYTMTFGGTSSAAPLVAGVMALAKEANPDLDTRLTKHLLARTSAQVDGDDSYWTTNGAGVTFNPRYGFGLMDAAAFVADAAQQPELTEQVSGSASWDLGAGQSLLDRPQDGWEWGYVGSVILAEDVFPYAMEEAIITLSVQAGTGSAWTPTELSVAIQSPSGLILDAAFFSETAASVSGLTDWSYVVNGFWGEATEGTWYVGVADGVTNGETGLLTDLALTFNTGQVVPEPMQAVLVAVTLVLLRIRRRFLRG